MTMPVSETKNIPKFDRKIYDNIAMNDLVTYGVYYLSEAGREIVDSDIVAICFLLFPRRFDLRGYPQWPDSTVVNKRWLDCRAKGLITGSAKDGFALTPKGMKLAEKVGKQLGGDVIPKKTLKPGLRSRSERFVNEILKSSAYNTYRNDGISAQISEYDFRGLLLCTMDSSAETLRSNLSQFKDHAENCFRSDLVQFLIFLGGKFEALLQPGSSKEEYRGGMVRQKIK